MTKLKPFIVIIAGGRHFDDYKLLERKCDKLLGNLTRPIIIRSGKAKGADALGERYAKERGYTVEEFPANWNRQRDGSYDKAAGHKRNREMAVGNKEFPEPATAAIVFWDGISRGSAGMIKFAEEQDLKVRVVNYEA